MSSFKRARLRLLAAAVSTAVMVSSLVVLASAASADTAPPATTPPAPATPTTVSADALPTVQIDGVVWSQVVVGNTVYAGGSFTNARPAGSAAGSNNVTRNNLLAYNITTGALVTSFVPDLNGQVLAVAASPDGKHLFVGGDFTKANGQTRSRIAEYDLTTNTLVANFKPAASTTVRALTATNSTVYFGGDFTTVAGIPRARLAAADAVTGAVLAWNPNADASVTAMTLTTDLSKVVVGGRFQNIGGFGWYGMAAIDPSSGLPLPWAATTLVRNAGTQSAITSLTATADGVYGTGYVFGSTGNLEGSFRADPATGNIIWIEDCHGDSYSVYANASDTVYVASHAHYCGNIGGFQQTPVPWATYRGTAFSKAATQTITADPYGYFNWAGNPAPTLLNWFPTFTTGSYTGQGQAGWSVTGNSQYVVYGGEFPTVNGTGQQGLVRFAVSSLAPNKIGPDSNDKLTPSVVSLKPGSVRVSWLATFDRDNTNLTYKVYRNFKSLSDTPIYTTTVSNTFYQRANLGFIDTTAVAGQTYNYRVYVNDPFGNQTSRGATTYTVPTAASAGPQTYPNAVLADAPSFFWRLGEASATSAYDYVAFNDGVKSAGVTQSTDGIIAGDPNTASTFSGDSTGTVVTQSIAPAPNTFTTEAWFKTTTTSGGKIIGYGGSSSGNSGNYDRQVYMDNSGRIFFGVYPGSVQTINSAAGYNDGNWHQVVATLGSNGMQLFLDGRRVANRGDVTAGQDYSGYWRVGGDSLNGWTNQPSSFYLAGAIDEVAVYPTVLTGAQINNHYVASGRPSLIPPRPSDAYGQAVYDLNPDLFWRLNENAGAIVAGDTGLASNSGSIGNGVTLGTAGALFGQTTTAGTFSGAQNGAVVEQNAEVGTTVYSEAVWFKTTTQVGGKLIGFGNSSDPTSTSSAYDRHVYMQNDGRLAFGTYTGDLNIALSPNSYNDGKWHLVVATQGSGGMVLYVDGQSVATNAQTSAQAYTGFWRIGGDNTWNSSSAWFAGSLDEAAVFQSTLTPAQVANLYAIGSAPPNQAPTAAFTSASAGLAASFDGTTSSDLDGSVASYAWDFGDNTTGTGSAPAHTYAASGTYTATLTVTDNSGATNSVSHPITVTVPNAPPVAAFTSTASYLVGSFDASGSSDPDGTVASYAWDFGDTTSGTGATTTHTYSAGGTYPVTLTVTDNSGATTAITKPITVVANQPPVAAFTSSAVNLVASFDSSTSSDPDGSIASYAWTFGDTTTGSGASPSHTYAAGGTYSVTLTVTDNAGATNAVTKSITVVAANVPPVAAFTSSAVNLVASFDSSTSSDPDGTIASYAWTFGDTTTGSGASPSHTYASAGTYPVTLTVTDNSGATTAVTKSITVAAANVAPTAAFTSGATNLATSFDGSTSSDPDGTISSYAWTFGDATTGSGATPSHTYAAGGTYSVTLTVTDNAGATNAVTKSITVVAANVPPVAAFTSSAVNLVASFNGSTSSDPDGTIASYAWTFGDTSSGSGATPSHPYAAAGTYSVTLTVTDNSGVTSAVTKSITVTAAGPVAFAQDLFGRTVTAGLGSADLGGAWTLSGGNTLFAVNGGAAKFTMSAPSSSPTASLGLASTNTDVRVDLSMDKAATGGGTYLTVIGRRVTSTSDYRAQVKVNTAGQVTLNISKRISNTETVLTTKVITGITYTPGMTLTLRLQVSGTATVTLAAKVWKTGTAEPVAFNSTATDSTAALAGAGGIGLVAYLSSSSTNAPVVATFDNLVAQPVQ